MAVQGHPRLLILAPMESTHATSCWSSIVILVVYLASWRYCRFSAENSNPPLFHPNFESVFVRFAVGAASIFSTSSMAEDGMKINAYSLSIFVEHFSCSAAAYLVGMYIPEACWDNYEFYRQLLTVYFVPVKINLRWGITSQNCDVLSCYGQAT